MGDREGQNQTGPLNLPPSLGPPHSILRGWRWLWLVQEEGLETLAKQISVMGFSAASWSTRPHVSISLGPGTPGHSSLGCNPGQPHILSGL